MNRKTFIRQCGFTCLGMAGVASIFESCSVSQQLNASIDDKNQMQIPLTAFIASGKGTLQQQYKRYVIATNDRLNYPIVVYRHALNEYTALLLRCSHQYNELTVNGDLLTCPAHGSEFNAKGEAVQGPAEDNLRSFAVSIDTKYITIHLV